MRRLLLCTLALWTAGCLNQVASLVGLEDGGAGHADSGPGAQDSGVEDAGSVVDAGSGAVDGGVGCGLDDAGICTDDSQCPDGYYCDFTLAACPVSEGDPSQSTEVYTVIPGSCLLACPDTGSETMPGALCYVAEDC